MTSGDIDWKSPLSSLLITICSKVEISIFSLSFWPFIFIFFILSNVSLLSSPTTKYIPNVCPRLRILNLFCIISLTLLNGPFCPSSTHSNITFILFIFSIISLFKAFVILSYAQPPIFSSFSRLSSPNVCPSSILSILNLFCIMSLTLSNCSNCLSSTHSNIDFVLFIFLIISLFKANTILSSL